MGLQQFDERNPVSDLLELDSANANTPSIAAAARTFDVRYDSIYVGNTDAIDHLIALGVTDNSGNFAWLGAINVPAGAGQTAVAIDLVSALLPTNQQFLLIKSGFSPALKLDVAMVGVSQILGVALGGSF